MAFVRILIGRFGPYIFHGTARSGLPPFEVTVRECPFRPPCRPRSPERRFTLCHRRFTLRSFRMAEHRFRSCEHAVTLSRCRFTLRTLPQLGMSLPSCGRPCEGRGEGRGRGAPRPWGRGGAGRALCARVRGVPPVVGSGGRIGVEAGRRASVAFWGVTWVTLLGGQGG